METASVSSRGTDAAEKEASRARESARRLEAEVQRLSTHLSQAQAAARSAILPNMQPALVLACPLLRGHLMHTSKLQGRDSCTQTSGFSCKL